MTRYEIVWKGPVHRQSGLGIASREYVKALRRQGLNVKVPGLNPMGVKKGNKMRILIYHHVPSKIDMKRERARFDRVILNTVWETTRVPSRWVPQINKFDAVCVPSLHNRTALRNSGVRIPIFIVPHGVHSKNFTPRNKRLTLKNAKGQFVFVSVFGFQHRKNPEALLRAYWEEFSPKDKVHLVIKTNGYAPYENAAWIRNKIAQYKKRLGLRKKTAPVTLLTRHMRPGQMRRLYAAGNAFVLPTRGEGVGLPFLEALSSGIPVIATGWGGHMDFLTRRNSFPVKYRLRPPAASMNGRAISRTFRHLFAEKGQLWAEVDIGHLRRRMRFAYAHPALCRKMGLQGRRDVAGLSWNRAGRLFKRAIDEVARKG